MPTAPVAPTGPVAHALHQIGQYTRAIKDLDKAIELRPMNAQAYSHRGNAWSKKNDFDKALKRIDVETSDNYVLGYYSSNPDPLKRRRQHRRPPGRDAGTAHPRVLAR